MEFVNKFAMPGQNAPEVKEKAYDLNFCFPVRLLENERVRLTPFIPVVHSQPFFEATSLHPDLYRFLPFGPYASAEDFVGDLVEGRVQRDPGMVLFAVFDKKNMAPDANGVIHSQLTLAGVIGLLNTSRADLCTEIGCVITTPTFQRTHVTSNAVGLLLQYCLDAAPHGLGLRRVQWQANAENRASVRVAERMGFRMEGVIRWQRILKPTKEGISVGGKDDKGPGRHTAMLSLCWDDWDEKRDLVMKETARKS